MNINEFATNKNGKDAFVKIGKRAMAKVVPLCLLAILIAGTVCSVANDMYAFVKEDNDIVISFENSLSVDDKIRIMSDNGVFENPHVFKLYVKLKHREALVEGFVGEVTLNPSMSYREILSNFS